MSFLVDRSLDKQALSPQRAEPLNTTDLLNLDERRPLAPGRKVFVNRHLRFDQIRLIGFDMDYTLAPYVKRNIEELSFRLTADKLVARGYPKEVADLPYDPDFVVRGLVVDKRLGNILKMDGHGHVGRVMHGRRAISKEERRQLYRQVRIRVSANRYHWIDTLFALPEAVLYTDIIELLEMKLGRSHINYWKLFDDIRGAIDECHRDGSLKTIVKANLSHYIEEDPELPLTLHRLRSAGKRLFVLTNSYWDYTNRVMSFLLNGRLSEYPEWRNFFDLVIVGAQKPSFFTDDNPLLRVHTDTGETDPEDVRRIERGGVYQGGSLRRVEQVLGDSGEHVLYVGDHIYGDIIRSKKDALWRTVLILEELEKEIQLTHDNQQTHGELLGLEERRALLDHEIMTLKVQLHRADAAQLAGLKDDALGAIKRQIRLTLDQKRRQLKQVIGRRDQLTDEIDRGYNPYWGSVFKEGADISRFGSQVEGYACLYTSRVSNFLYYSPVQYFRAPRHWMAHEKQ